jgi:hypothetical protein
MPAKKETAPKNLPPIRHGRNSSKRRLAESVERHLKEQEFAEIECMFNGIADALSIILDEAKDGEINFKLRRGEPWIGKDKIERTGFVITVLK